MNSKSSKGAKAVETSDFLPFLDPWPVLTAVDQGRYSALDLEIMRGLR